MLILRAVLADQTPIKAPGILTGSGFDQVGVIFCVQEFFGFKY